MLVIEIVSWVAIAVFVFLISQLDLMTPFERVGAVCTAFLVSTAISLPVVLVRRGTALERRLDRVSNGVAMGVVLLVVVVTCVVAAVYWWRPARFI